MFNILASTYTLGVLGRIRGEFIAPLICGLSPLNNRGPPSHTMTVQGPSFGSAPPASTVQSERSALTKVMWFGIIQLVGLVAGWVIYFYAFGSVFTTFASLGSSNSPPAQVTAALSSVFQTFTLLMPISLGIELVAIVLLLIGFREFSRVDPSKFSTPSKLTYLLLIGVIIAGAAAVLLFSSFPAIFAQMASSSGSTPSSAFQSAIAGLLTFSLLAFVGGILALIGFVGGQILGLWRVGSKYDETVIKLGSIFVVIPFLNIVAPILILVGASQAKGKLGTA
jgi:Protein of unknown function (DUF973)